MFFWKMRHFEKKNTPTAKKDLKWPTFKASVKSRNYIYRKGGAKRHTSSL